MLCFSAGDLCCDAAVAFVGNTKSIRLTFVLQSIMVQNALPSCTRAGGCSCVMDECSRLATSAFLPFSCASFCMYLFLYVRGRWVVFREVVPGAAMHYK